MEVVLFNSMLRTLRILQRMQPFETRHSLYCIQLSSFHSCFVQSCSLSHEQLVGFCSVGYNWVFNLCCFLFWLVNTKKFDVLDNLLGGAVNVQRRVVVTCSPEVNNYHFSLVHLKDMLLTYTSLMANARPICMLTCCPC